MEYLQNSTSLVAGLSAQSERLRPVLGGDFSKIMDVAKRAENLRLDVEKNAITIANVMIIMEVLQSSLGIVKDALLILNEELTRKEESIDSLLPTEELFVGEKHSLKRAYDFRNRRILEPFEVWAEPSTGEYAPSRFLSERMRINACSVQRTRRTPAKLSSGRSRD